MLSRPQNCSENVRAACNRIADAARAAGRNVDSVTLLAVSKGQSSAAIVSAASAGVEHFGENFVQESLPKMEALTGRELPGADCAFTVHAGPYDAIGAAYAALAAWMRERGHESAGPPRETYVVGPCAGRDPVAYRTEIAWPVR